MRSVALLLILGLAFAQPSAQPYLSLGDTTALIQVLDAAQRQILFQAPALRGDPRVAEALSRAVRERGVRVFVLTERRRVYSGGELVGDSFIPWLWAHTLNGRYSNLQVRLSDGPLQPVLVIDEAYLVQGPLLWRSANPLEEGLTVAFRSPTLAAQAAAQFLAAWRGGGPFEWKE